MVLVLDNYDSFTYNLVHYLEAITGTVPEVMLNDAVDLEKISRCSHLVLSPGPGLPKESGALMEVIRRYYKAMPILGVCLGHQALAEFFGARLLNLDRVQHGVASRIRTVSDDPIYRGLPAELEVGRYHSWVVDRVGFPEELEITATDEAGDIMSFRHRQLPVTGVQYHPESIMTPQGMQLLKNWLTHSGNFR